jgi:hypothetical protein
MLMQAAQEEVGIPVEEVVVGGATMRGMAAEVAVIARQHQLLSVATLTSRLR